jgi:hypothetical protein
MPGLRLVALAAALVLAAPGCKKASKSADPTADADRPSRRGRDDSGPKLPPAHKLTQEPDAGAFVAEPATILAGAQSYLPELPQLSVFARLVVATQAPTELADKIAPQIVGDRPWAAVHVAGEDIVVLPVRDKDAIGSALAGLPASGDFGAVEVPAAAIDIDPRDGKPPAPRLAWLDKQNDSLVFAATLPGLATSRQLARTYGARPLWGTLSAARARALVPEFPYARVAAVGDGLHALELTALAEQGATLPVPKDIAPGALTGMLRGPDLAVGGSTRWPGHKKAVGEIIRQINAAVDNAGFAAKLMLDPLADQAARALRRWNGRVMVAVGPARHLRAGFGADDPAAAQRDTLGFFRTLLDNLSLARMFVDVPGASLRKHSDSPQVHVLTVDGLSRNVPAAARPVLDDKGRLRVAFGASERAGGLLVVIGPDPGPVAQKWIAAADQGDDKATADDLISGVFSLSPDRVRPLLEALQAQSQGAFVGAVLGLQADRDPTTVVVEQKPDRYHATVRGPELTPAQVNREAGGRTPR